MDFLLNLEYNEIKAEGNNPLLLGTGKIWLVKEGQVDIFAARIANAEPAGRRKYLFSVQAGDLLSGTEPAVRDEKEYGLLAVGFTGTRVLEIDLQSLNAITDESQKKLTGLLNRWMKNWTGAGITEIPQVDWDTGLRQQLESTASFNEASFEHVLEAFISEQHEEILRNKIKSKKDQSFMRNGLNRLVSSMNPKQKLDMDTEEADDDDLLYKACAAVGRSKEIKIVPSKGLKKSESKDPLGDIARASQIRTRQVILKDKWWKEDNGAFLAYKEKEDGEYPVALLPVSPKKYHLYDPADESMAVVDESEASTVKPHAYTFYRPLPVKTISYNELLKFLARGIWKRDIAAILIMGILGGLLGMLTPVVTGKIFDSVIPDGEKVLLTQIGFLLMAIAATTFAFNLTRAFAMHRIEGRTESDLQAAVWDRLLSLPVPFFKNYTAGELAERGMGISKIRSILSGAVINTVISFIFSIFYFLLLFYYSWRLALICMVIVIFVMGISLLFGFLQIRYEHQLIDVKNKLAGKVFNLLSGVSKIKTSGAEKRAFYNWAEQFSEVRDVTFKKENLGNKLEVFNSTVNVIATGIIFYSVIKVKKIDLAPGAFIAFSTAFSKFLSSMLEVSNVVLQLNIIKPIYERIRPILETPPEFDQEKADPGELEGNIEVSHVNFRYEKDGPLILNDVTLEIKQGDYVGIVGTSGSGKSTLFRILLGFEKPESGQVYYDQQDLENVDIRAVRRQLGVVLQGGQLMSGSIFDNIVSANPGLTINHAWEAARMAGMEEDIKSMPMGMHTVVSEDGGTLSGGQKQRLLIARAVITRPKIVYFDEATSALDNKTQKIVSESLASLNATRVLIAHRLSTIADCSKIIVLDRGRVVESGTYDELFKQNGLFTQLVKRQLA
ncbi:MAG: NHLP bacteriocin export ABC transporter permease/ATPase subunit [Clostridiales bacterium]|nr:NHLP bacteriocin export ABC transporter permease/ATPase subunit [Clostridiales bacterium]MCF8022343.1 NHLP bacteriocin export ABC transporter permease/ATPase subunit [Clostridiales bacterium]